MNENLDERELSDQELNEVNGGAWKKGTFFKLKCANGSETYYIKKEIAQRFLEFNKSQGIECKIFSKY